MLKFTMLIPNSSQPKIQMFICAVLFICLFNPACMRLQALEGKIFPRVCSIDSWQSKRHLGHQKYLELNQNMDIPPPHFIFTHSVH